MPTWTFCCSFVAFYQKTDGNFCADVEKLQCTEMCNSHSEFEEGSREGEVAVFTGGGIENPNVDPKMGCCRLLIALNRGFLRIRQKRLSFLL